MHNTYMLFGLRVMRKQDILQTNTLPDALVTVPEHDEAITCILLLMTISIQATTIVRFG